MFKNFTCIVVLLLLSSIGYAQTEPIPEDPIIATPTTLLRYKANAWVKLVPAFVSSSGATSESESESESESTSTIHQKRIGETSHVLTDANPVRYVYELWNDDYSILIESKEWSILDLTGEWTFYQIEFDVTQQLEETNMLVYIKNEAVQGHTVPPSLFIDDLVISPIDAKYSYTSNDKFGNVTHATAVNENHTRTIYDEWARPVTSIDQNKEIVATFKYNTSTNFTTNHNYNEITTFVESGKFTTAREYLDGFGKSKQTIISEPSTNLKQVTTTVEYDNLGRPIKVYKPFALPGSTLPNRIITNYISQTTTTYGANSRPYAETNYENWPEAKPTQTHLPRLNSEVARTTVVDDNASPSKQFGARNYGANQLIANETTNEDGDIITSYTDKQGRTIAAVTPIGFEHVVGTYGDISFNSGSSFSYATTLFEYDEANNLKKVTDPTGKVITYAYNSLGQLIQEVNPDKGNSMYKYDQFGRLRFSKDQKDITLLSPTTGASAFIDHFSYNKYDKWDRLTESGMIKMSLRSPVGTVPVFNDKDVVNDDNYPNDLSFGREKHIALQFDGTMEENSLNQLTDEFVFSNHIFQNGKLEPQFVDNMHFSYNYRGQMEQQVYNLDGLSAGHRFDYSYNLLGLPVNTRYNNPVNTAYNLKQAFKYDDKGRLVNSSSANGNNALNQDVEYTYDALGRLFKKGLAPTGNSADPFQEYVAYNYNIRENQTLQMGKLFKNELYYDIKGNITTQVWNNSYFDNTVTTTPYVNHHYRYAYDKLNRLVGANYTEMEYNLNPYVGIEAGLSTFPALLTCGPVVLQNADEFLGELKEEAEGIDNGFLLATTSMLQQNISELEAVLADQEISLDELTSSEVETYVQDFTQVLIGEEEKMRSATVLLADISKTVSGSNTPFTTTAAAEIEIINSIKGKIQGASLTTFTELITADYQLIFDEEEESNAEKILLLESLTISNEDKLQLAQEGMLQLKTNLITACSINVNAMAYQTLTVNDQVNRVGLNSRKYDVDYQYQRNGNFNYTNRYDQLEQRTQINYTYGATNNQLTKVDWNDPLGVSTTNYNYDAVGNLTNDLRSGVTNITYNQFHNLPTNMVKSNGDEHFYRYTSGGQRSVKRLSAADTEYYLNGVVVNKNDKPKQYSITDGFATLSTGNTLEKSYTVSDWLGSTRLVINAAGNVENVRDHYPYGLLMNDRNFSSNTEGARFQYTGHEYDGETTFGYHGARYYNRELGRYMSMDPHSASYANLSPYAYVAGNPIRLVDPDGRDIIYSKNTKRKDKRIFKRQQRQLNRESATAKANYKKLKDSDNVHTVHVNEKDSKGKLFKNEVVEKGEIDRKNGNGTDIFINTTKKTTEGVSVPNKIVQGHEFGHAFRLDQGLVMGKPKFDPFDASYTDKLRDNGNLRARTEEREASKIENIIRQEVNQSTGSNIPRRSRYSNVVQFILNERTGRPELKQITIPIP